MFWFSVVFDCKVYNPQISSGFKASGSFSTRKHIWHGNHPWKCVRSVAEQNEMPEVSSKKEMLKGVWDGQS